MFEQTVYKCPSCGSFIRQKLTDDEEIQCASCRRHFRVLLDDSSGKAGLIDLTAKNVPEPLYLPKGSIRALVTLVMTGTACLAAISGQAIPPHLLDLLLAIVAYYFGFRHKAKAADSRIVDASSRAKAPLMLPGGVIRTALTLGFAVVAIVLHSQGKLLQPEIFGFVAILGGLIVGYYFGRLIAPMRESAAGIALNHAKGLVVIVSALVLSVLTLTGAQAPEHLELILAAVVSFYFGSRS